MESKIVSLAKDGNTSGLLQQVKGLKQEQIPDILRRQASKNPSDLTTLIQGVFQGSPVSEPGCLQRRLQVFIHTVKLLQNIEITNKVATEMVGFLMFETNSLSASGLAELANLFIDAVKNKEATNGKAFELLPNILAALATKETVVYGNNTMTGTEFKNHILNTLCSSRWESHCIIHLAAVFKDVPLTSEQLQFFLVKIVRLLKNTDLQELPPVVYQLLALSVKGHRKLVLEGIMNHMNEQDKLCKQQHADQDGEGLVSVTPETLRHVEGTIILHMRYSIMKDMELGREFIKLLKTGQQSDAAKVLTPFNVALALSIAHIRRFEEPIFDFLKAAVLKSFKDAERQKNSKWIAELVPKASDVTGMILETVQNSSHGWDHVTEGMVQLGFTLMDAFGPKPGPFGKAVESSGQPSTPAQKSCDLGAQILLDTFKVHEMVRSEVLEQILNRVVTKTTAPVTHYLDLLSKVISSAPQVLLDSLSKLKEAFDFLAYLPLSSAEGLMRSVQPLMKLNVSLKDALMLVLRKAMFARYFNARDLMLRPLAVTLTSLTRGRQGDSRKIAVSGYLQILKHFQVYGSLPASQSSQTYGLNQTQVDVHTRAQQPNNYEAIVCMEILANLRRCFTQDADVRLILYQGLYDVLCRNSKLKDSILNMLTTQLRKYYEMDDDVTPPMKLEPCIMAQGEQVFLAEPLSHLLQSVSQCILRTRKILDEHTEEMEDEDEEEEEMTKHVLEQLEKIMESLTRRMIKSEMEDFELDKSADFSLGNSVGVKNNIFAILVLGLYDVLIEHNFADSKFSVASGEQVIQLFSNYHTLAEILRDKSGGGKKGKANNKVPCSLLSIKFVTMVMRALFCDEMPDHQQCLALLREQDNFVRHLVSVAVQKVQQVNDTGHCDGPEGRNKEKIYNYCCSLARVFLQKFSSDMVTPEQGRKEKGKAISSLCLEGLAITVNIMSSRYPTKVASFLHAANPDVEEGDTETMSSEDTVHLHIKKFQRMVMDMLTTDEEDTSLKDAVYLCNIISTLIKHLNPERAQFAQVLSWVTRVCKEQNIEDTNLTKALVGLLFSTSFQAKDNIILLREIARDVHGSLGDIDQDVEVEDGTTYSIVNHKTAAPTVLLLLLGQADKALEETEWLIARMKGDLSKNTTNDNTEVVGSTQMEDEEKAACSRLGTLVNAFQEIIQSAVPVGACIDASLKVVTRLYNTLTLLTKYYLALYTQQSGHMSPRFEKLVKLFASNLSKHAYSMITYVQTIQTEKLSRIGGGKGGKAKDKKKNDDGNGGGGDAGGQTSGKARMVMKESRSIPNLVFAIEQTERFLIRLTKKSKVDLMQHIKLSTSRDFRINAAVLQAALEEQELSSDEESSGGEETEDQENQEPADSQEPASKKSKTEGKPSKLASKRGKKTATK